ncbi:hypothetical protein, partial [Paenibacillus sp. OSY-SE]|uniref:hypothetical protein n=1 Tax=Paenibacillus sp. OSY-SE TaxID=1196323 RepID=UPI001ED90454
ETYFGSISFSRVNARFDAETAYSYNFVSKRDPFSAPRRLQEPEEGEAECRPDYMSIGLRG